MMDPQIITHEEKQDQKIEVNYVAAVIMIVVLFLAGTGLYFWIDKLF